MPDSTSRGGTGKTEDRVTRFWAKVKKGQGCWEWQASTNLAGYGVFWVEGKAGLAHRVSWEIANGPVPGELCVLHECDNPPCVNPTHLFIGTRADNYADMVAKGRRWCKPIKTHCVNGHKFTELNTYIRPEGSRVCRKCVLQRGVQWRTGQIERE